MSENIYGLESEIEGISRFSSGCTLLDCVIGGGWPVGRMINVVGDKSTSKTGIAIEACANFSRQFPNGKIYYIETEAAFDESYARILGLPESNFELIEDVRTVEDLFNFFTQLIEDEKKNKEDEPVLCIVDSLDALSDEAELGRKITDGTFGANRAKKLHELFRRLNADMSKSSITFMIISQVKDNIGVMFGEKHTRTGGKSLDFYASLIVWLAHKGKKERTRKGVKQSYGINIKAQCKKNKVGIPFRVCEFPVIWNYGIDDLESCLNWMLSSEMKNFDWGYERKELEAMLKKIDTLEIEVYNESVDAIRPKVIETWNEVQKMFAPKRTKY